MKKNLKNSCLEYLFLTVLFAFITLIVTGNRSDISEREQLIADFIEAAFAHGVGEGPYGENVPMTLHRWERETISISFAAKVQTKFNYYPEGILLDEKGNPKISYGENGFYEAIENKMPHLIDEMRDLTGKNFVFEKYSMNINEVERIWVRPSLEKSSLPFSEDKCYQNKIVDMTFDHPPYGTTFFYSDRCKNVHKGMLFQEPYGRSISYSICQFNALEEGSIVNLTRECLFHAMGLPTLVNVSERRFKSSDENIIRLLYCPELKSGMTIEEVKTVLRGSANCFSQFELKGE